MSAWSERYGPWAIVTGASDGIGKAMATELAARGVSVVLVARRVQLLDELAVTLSEAHGVKALVLEADLSQQAGIDAALSGTRDLDVGLLVASAGFGTSGPFVDSDLDRELTMLAVNCNALLQLVHSSARRFRDRRRGGIVLMSSLVGFQGVPRAAHYAATKAYVQALAEGLRRELSASGVDVLSSAPGPVLSGFGGIANMKITLGAAPSTVARETLDALGHKGTVRPGWLSKVLEGALSTLPRRFRVLVMERVMAGMTSHQPG